LKAFIASNPKKYDLQSPAYKTKPIELGNEYTNQAYTYKLFGQFRDKYVAAKMDAHWTERAGDLGVDSLNPFHD